MIAKGKGRITQGLFAFAHSTFAFLSNLGKKNLFLVEKQKNCFKFRLITTMSSKVLKTGTKLSI